MGLIRTLLVANRGEIARRILRTARETGISTVAVYSPEDRHAPHAREADRALPVDDYLSIGGILEAARHAGADAVHPGYGFLSENPDFSAACAGAGLRFVGPPPEAMRAVGNKEAARRLAQEVGVPVVPGASDGPDLEERGPEVGFPLLVKAADGGGGKGMRLVTRREELAEAIEAARRESRVAFGSERVFLERCIRPARHVEVQVLADGQGGCVHLGERECSVQRRHQKVLEESPSPFVDGALRERLGDAAVRLARASGYVGAGTVEFLLDAERRFYFLEVNARLQVEHPVTEMVCGLDLVRLQLAIAAGRPLPFCQEDVRPRGWAIEARICAEDPGDRFLPAPGPVLLWREPGGPGVRVDSGIETGGRVPDRYDPLVAKVIAHGEDRAAAIARLRRALRETVLLGTASNTDFLQDVLSHPAFEAGALHTGFLEEHFSEWEPAPPAGPEVWALAAAASGSVAPGHAGEGGRGGGPRLHPWTALANWGRM